MSLIEMLKADYKDAMRNKDVMKKGILNYVIAQIKNKEIDAQKELQDEDVIQVLKKEIKSRKESISFLEKAGNAEEVDIENKNIEILSVYLPEMYDENKTKELVDEYMKNLNIEDAKKQRGMLIGGIMKDHKASIDGSILNNVINNL